MSQLATGSTVLLTIEGLRMPGRSCAPDDAASTYENVHVGVQHRQQAVDLVPGDAPSARWTFPLSVETFGGSPDFRGTVVHGRRGDRFVYLSWGVVEGSDFSMFRRAKLHFADVPEDVLLAAERSGVLHCRLDMTDACGLPRCARVRPPDVVWTSLSRPVAQGSGYNKSR